MERGRRRREGRGERGGEEGEKRRGREEEEEEEKRKENGRGERTMSLNKTASIQKEGCVCASQDTARSRFVGVNDIATCGLKSFCLRAFTGYLLLVSTSNQLRYFVCTTSVLCYFGAKKETVSQ